MINKANFFFKIIFIYYFLSIPAYANLKQDLINKLTSTKTLSFNFEQKISNKKEIGNCIIKYPLLMKCNYENVKKKIIISNGKKLAIIKKNIKKFIFIQLNQLLYLRFYRKKKFTKYSEMLSQQKLILIPLNF